MEKQLQYFDVLANTQKQVLNNLMSTQKDLRAQWIDAVGKSYSALTSLPGMPETALTKDALGHFNNWFGSVANSSKSATEEVLKTQENMFIAYEKQVAINRDVLKSFIGVVNPIIAANPILAKAKLA